MESQKIEQELLLFGHRDPCPYLPGRERGTHFFYAQTFSPVLYEMLISKGFRRSGYTFYQHHCPHCTACLPIRTDVRRFRPSTSQRRVLKKNRDVTYTRQPVAFTDEDFLLYRRYCERRHSASPLPDEAGYIGFLIESPIPTEMMRYYVQDRLVGIGWIDLLPHSLSSVYFSFDPDEASRSLGTFSILQQIELCRVLGKTWLHLGFWVQKCQNMTYKNHFNPHQFLIDGTWKEI